MLETYLGVPDVLLQTLGGAPLIDYVGALAMGIIGYLVGVAVNQVVYLLFKQRSERLKVADKNLLRSLYGPITLFFAALGIVVAGSYLSLLDGATTLVSRIVLLLILLWSCLRLTDILVELYFRPLACGDNRLYKQLTPVVRRGSKIILWVLFGITILDISGINVGALLAGLGIGGLAVAFASKETLENLIAGFLIFLDKPFMVGDYVELNGTSGNIVEVGIRTTRMRKSDQSLVIFPNRTIVDGQIINYSGRTHRNVDLHLRFAYDTDPAKLVQAQKMINKLLNKYEQVGKDDRFIYFSETKDDAHVLFVQYYIHDMDAYWDLQQEINSKIFQGLKKAKITLVEPTQRWKKA